MQQGPWSPRGLGTDLLQPVPLRPPSPEQHGTGAAVGSTEERSRVRGLGPSFPRRLQVPAGTPALTCRRWFPADFVLVWEEDLRLGRPPDSAPRDKAATHAAWRDTFLENLRAAGLHVDQVLAQGPVSFSPRPTLGANVLLGAPPHGGLPEAAGPLTPGWAPTPSWPGARALRPT